MDPTYLPRLIELMRNDGFSQDDILDAIGRMSAPPVVEAAKACRERIATAIFAAMFAYKGTRAEYDIADAVAQADALIAELAK